MIRKVTKFFLDFEREEKWLNEMSAKGLHFISYVFPRYIFEEGKPGEYIYRVELLDQLPEHAESKAYLGFLEETGVEHLDTFFRWVYLRKQASDGPFDIYTDYNSRIKHYQRIMTLVGIIVGIQIGIGVSNIIFNLSLKCRAASLYITMPNFLVAVLLSRLFFSYRKRANKLKAEAKLRE